MIKKIILFLVLFLVIFQTAGRQNIFAQSKEEFEKAQVISVDKEGVNNSFGAKLRFQDLTLKIIDGSDVGKTIELENGGDSFLTDSQLAKVGDILILDKTDNGINILDKYRLNSIPFLIIGFVILLLLVAGLSGIGSIAGLIISLAVILLFIIPQILHGANPLFVTIIGSLVILVVSTYLAHGISKKTTIALTSTFIALIIASILSIAFVNFTNLAGIGDDEAVSLLTAGATQNINLQGLLLSGIIIGTLGALNDITTTQSATIFELHETNKNLSFDDLVKKGSRVGREHIVSLVNTLVLAYAGSALAIFIYFELNPGGQPLWVVLNNEIIIDEVVRTIAGTCGLILAIPICTFLASWWVKRK
ncbi:MAG TPA: YibE/F family protein [Patescibacteria group bacterium]|nr:YibE/F family protein [Patescibacteria group bacterium]